MAKKTRAAFATLGLVVAWALAAPAISEASTVFSASSLPVLIGSISAAPNVLSATGGNVIVVGDVENATSCQIELLSKQSFPVIYSHDPKTCISGSYSAHVTVGSNQGSTNRKVAFALLARNRSSSSVRRFYLTLDAPPPRTTKTSAVTTSTLPLTTTTLPSVTATTLPGVTTTTGPNSKGETSPNWSGYVDIGGPFTAIKGSFNASQLIDGTQASDVMAEWVGIDGGTSASQDLIQAGIMESMEPCNGTAINSNGSYTPNSFHICPWTFFIGNGSTSEGPIPDITVSAGDTVTVEISGQSGGTWAISMTDNTSGASWSQGGFDYAGPGDTAEWIVEAPTNSATGNVDTLAPYDKPVDFSGCGVTGTGSMTAVTMEQNGVYVSTPGPYTNGAFTLGYTGDLSSPGLEGRMSGSTRWVSTLGTPVLQADH